MKSIIKKQNKHVPKLLGLRIQKWKQRVVQGRSNHTLDTMLTILIQNKEREYDTKRRLGFHRIQIA